MNYHLKVGNLLVVGFLAGCQLSEKKVAPNQGENLLPASTYRALNPIAPPGVYIADPEVRQMLDGRIYV